MRQWFLDRFGEPSSWVALAVCCLALAVAMFVPHLDAGAQTWLLVIAVVAGLVGLGLPERFRGF